ncbi:hypothetical protein EJB05_46995 [Eragrostis curvula]|uniref:Uncharacterized protein n=1 Tax=Eragrostis curvula TaxID=38414 RepID=A0A5J9T7K5_9POAL|nr:hypothetical protein EJB05_46995 [Eragrostis curvula]
MHVNINKIIIICKVIMKEGNNMKRHRKVSKYVQVSTVVAVAGQLAGGELAANSGEERVYAVRELEGYAAVVVSSMEMA